MANLLEREEAAKRYERNARREANIRRQQAESAKMTRKANPEEILKGLMVESEKTSSQEIGKGKFVPISEQDIRIKLSEARAKTDNAIEALNNAQERLSTAEKNYKGNNKEQAFEKLRAQIEILKRDVRIAEKEEKYIEGFSENGSQIVKIYNIEQKAIDRKQRNFEKEKQELSKNKKRLAEVKAIISKVDKETRTIRQEERKLDRRIAELVRKTERFGKGKAEITEEEAAQQIEDLKEISNLSAQKDNIGKQLAEKQKDKNVQEALSEQKSLETKIKESETKIKLYEKGESEEDKVIHKCKLARNMLLAGKTWDEINLAAIEEIQERQSKTKEQKTAKTPPKQTEPAKTEPEAQSKPESKYVRDDEAVPYFEPGTAEAILSQRGNASKSEPEPESKSTPPVPAKWSERHSKISSRIPFFAKAMDKITEIGNSKVKPFFARVKDKVMKTGEETKATDKKEEVKRSNEPVQQTPKASPDKEPDIKSISAEKDKFIEYLQEAVKDGHTEPGKYATEQTQQPVTQQHENENDGSER